MTVRSVAAVLNATLLVAAAAFFACTASAQMTGLLGNAAEAGAAGGGTEVSTLPEPLTRKAIRDVLSSLDDGQARELLLRELDRQVTAREAELAAADERTVGALLGEWSLALGRAWLRATRNTPTIPAAAAKTFDSFQSRRGDASVWRLAGTLVLCLLAGLAAAFAALRLTRRTEERLDGLSASSLWSRIGIISGRFVLQGVRLLAFVVAAFLVDSVVNRPVPPDSLVVPHPGQRGRLDLARGDGGAFRAVAQAPEPEAVHGR